MPLAHARPAPTHSCPPTTRTQARKQGPHPQHASTRARVRTCMYSTHPPARPHPHVQLHGKTATSGSIHARTPSKSRSAAVKFGNEVGVTVVGSSHIMRSPRDPSCFQGSLRPFPSALMSAEHASGGSSPARVDCSRSPEGPEGPWRPPSAGDAGLW